MRAGGRRALVLDPEPAYPAAPLVANYQMTRHLLGYVGYSHFFTGAFINRSGPAGTATSSMRRSGTRSERDGTTASTGTGFPGITRPN